MPGPWPPGVAGHPESLAEGYGAEGPAFRHPDPCRVTGDRRGTADRRLFCKEAKVSGQGTTLSAVMVRRVGAFGVLLGLAGLVAGCHPPPNPAANSSTSPSPTGPSYTL